MRVESESSTQDALGVEDGGCTLGGMLDLVRGRGLRLASEAGHVLLRCCSGAHWISRDSAGTLCIIYAEFWHRQLTRGLGIGFAKWG